MQTVFLILYSEQGQSNTKKQHDTKFLGLQKDEDELLMSYFFFFI